MQAQYGSYGMGGVGHHAAYGDHYSRLGDAHDMVGATYLGDRTWVGSHGPRGGRYPSRADPRF
jgi:hypothetical protein